MAAFFSFAASFEDAVDLPLESLGGLIVLDRPLVVDSKEGDEADSFVLVRCKRLQRIPHALHKVFCPFGPSLIKVKSVLDDQDSCHDCGETKLLIRETGRLEMSRENKNNRNSRTHAATNQIFVSKMAERDQNSAKKWHN